VVVLDTRVGLAEMAKEPRGTLDVREYERDGPRGKFVRGLHRGHG
jgi:hypothetical protein